ncbi:MAG: hypothetical protein H0X64_07365 [Gemmatimonadaceae bacterium]|nr:hypothetical protein [Gemmatimonadaceae bacterium]
MHDLTRFGLSDVTRIGAEFRRLSAGASSMEAVGGRIVRTLYDGLATDDGPACALVRMFVTVPFERLDDEQRRFALTLLGGTEPAPAMKCLTLLATAGELPEWNDRRSSVGHLALPLPSPESVSRSPMIAQLIRQLGVEIGSLLSADPALLVDNEQHTFNVFHVEHAKGSPFIPAQLAFVEPYRVHSVLGFGGLLPPGELFATILFSRTPIPRETADLFRTLALNVKVALLPFAGDRVFA